MSMGKPNPIRCTCPLTRHHTRTRPLSQPRTRFGFKVASKQIFSLLRFEGARPVWDQPLMDEYERILRNGETVSCPHYPHSAEDILVACQTFAEDIKGGEWAVWSSISPWVEVTLLKFGVKEVTTVDYNEPKVVNVPRLKTFGQAG